MRDLFYILLSAIGLRPTKPTHFTGVERTIEAMPVTAKFRWLVGGAFHFFFVAVVLIGLFYSNSKKPFFYPDKLEIGAVWLAATWSFLGPVLIWFYGRHALSEFEKGCMEAINNASQRQLMRNETRRYLFDTKIFRFISFAWVAGVGYGLYQARQFILDFGLSGYLDPYFLLICFGAIILAFYSSIGVCFFVKTLQLTALLSQCGLKDKIFSEDRVFGLSFVGRFAYKSAWMFLSGWFFAPLFMTISWHRKLDDHSALIALITVYFLCTVLSFVVPTYLIRRKILAEKMRLRKPIAEQANKLALKLSHKWKESDSKQLDLLRALLGDVHSLPNWPFDPSTLAKFSLQSIIGPVVTLAISWLRTGPLPIPHM